MIECGIMAWYKKDKLSLPASLNDADKTIRTEGLFSKCEGCRAIIWKKDLGANENVCPKCNYHAKLRAREHLQSLFAEPGALIGFAGPRVIEQAIRQKLPKGLQRSEFLLEHGMLAAIVDGRDLREYLTNALYISLS